MNLLNKKLSMVFKGAYARDQLASLKTFAPVCYVVITKLSSSIGEHWLAIHMLRSQTAVHFDSFGFLPEHLEFIRF